MAKLSQLKNIKFLNILLFLLGFTLSCFIPQFEMLINKVAQYIVGMVLLSTAFIYFNKTNWRLKYLLGGIMTSVSFQGLNSASYYVELYTNKEGLVILLVLITIFALIFFNKIKLNLKYIIVGLLLSITIQSIYLTYVTSEYIINNPKEWDFLCFYLNGNVAIQGLNFYEPENYIKVFSQLHIPIKTDYEFYRWTVEVAFEYFPQNIFLFLPLGLSDFITMHIIWDIFLILFMILDIYLILKIFYKELNFINYIFVIPLFLLFPAVNHSIISESVSIIMLFIVLLIWKEKNDNLMGLWLSIGIAIKPIMLIFFLYPLLRKKWKAFFYAVFYTLIALIITIISFSPSIVISFFTKNTIKNLPNWSYIHHTNKSLLSTILRLTNYDFSLSSPLFHPLFLIIGSIISIISLWLIYKLDKYQDEMALAILILYTLLIYPNTMNHYIILALPVIFFLLKSIDINKSFNYFIPMVIVSSFYFMFRIQFATLLILWLFIIYFTFSGIRVTKLQLLNDKFK